MGKSEQLSITLPSEIVEKLRNDASENFRSMSAEIAYVASRYFIEKDKQDN